MRISGRALPLPQRVNDGCRTDAGWVEYGLYKMKLPGAEIAIVDDNKLTDYCLNPEHPRGKHKARIFAKVLGITRENVDILQTALKMAASTEEAELVFSDSYGDRYVIDSEIHGPRGAGIVRSLWILRHGESTPRLTSCYVK